MDLFDLSKSVDGGNIEVTMHDFLMALDEVKPAFDKDIITMGISRCFLEGVLFLHVNIIYPGCEFYLPQFSNLHILLGV